MAGWRCEGAGCRSTLSIPKIKVKIFETKYRSFYNSLTIGDCGTLFHTAETERIQKIIRGEVTLSEHFTIDDFLTEIHACRPDVDCVFWGTSISVHVIHCLFQGEFSNLLDYLNT